MDRIVEHTHLFYISLPPLLIDIKVGFVLVVSKEIMCEHNA